jgi:hypothetical protein
VRHVALYRFRCCLADSFRRAYVHLRRRSREAWPHGTRRTVVRTAKSSYISSRYRSHGASAVISMDASLRVWADESAGSKGSNRTGLIASPVRY